MRFVRTALICGALALVALVAAGCGSSSNAGSGSTSTQANASAGGNNRQQIADCLKKQGVTLPQRRPGTRPPNGGGNGGGGGGFFFGGGGGGAGASGPQGANSGRFAKIQAALKKCGIKPQRTFGGGGFRANSARYRTALTKFAACVRKNGYDLPKPNTSGKGPVFDASKVNRNDPKFKAAVQKCQSDLQALRPRAGAGGGPPVTPPATTSAG